MRRASTSINRLSRRNLATASSTSAPIVNIQNATFYRRQPATSQDEEANAPNRPLFPNLSYSLSADDASKEKWCIIGPSNAGKTSFLEVLRGQHLCFPPTARTYPWLSSDALASKDQRLRYPQRALQYAGFSDSQRGLGGFGAHMSARYESRREKTDFSVVNYLRGNTQLNPAENTEDTVDENLLERVMDDLNLRKLADMPVANLSNGQTRRARIAKALLGKPEVLLLDEPFMGLDPPTTVYISNLLQKLAESNDPRLFLALRPQDPVPDWITHVLYLGEPLQITHRGPKSEVKEELSKQKIGSSTTTLPGFITETPKNSEVIVQMQGVQVKYGDKIVLGDWREDRSEPMSALEDEHTEESRPTTSTKRKLQPKDGLYWTVKRGERWGVFGPNGSGKTTLISMITSDHPQAYSNPLEMFGRHRLPTPGAPGLSIFELQARIGHSSPELHAYFPRHLSVRQAIESAFASTPLAKPGPRLTTEADHRISAALRWFQAELAPHKGPYIPSPRHKKEPVSEIRQQRRKLEEETAVEWADDTLFGEMPYSGQKVALFIRALVAEPDLVVLDEAFSGLDELTRDRCLLFLESGESRRLVPKDKSATTLISGQPAAVKGQQKYKGVTWAWPTGLTQDQALIVVSHVKEEVPASVKQYLFLPGQDAVENQTKDGKGRPMRKMGKIHVQALRMTQTKWGKLWGMEDFGSQAMLT